MESCMNETLVSFVQNPKFVFSRGQLARLGWIKADNFINFTLVLIRKNKILVTKSMFRPIPNSNENGRSVGYFIPNKVSSLDRSSILNKSNNKKQVTFRDISNSIVVQPDKKTSEKYSFVPPAKSQSQKNIRKNASWNKNQAKNLSAIKNKYSKKGDSTAQKTMKNLLQNRSLLLEAQQFRAPITHQATELVKERMQGADIRKCQSENKMKKFDYLGDRECRNVEKYNHPNPVGEYMMKRDYGLETRTRYNSHETRDYRDTESTKYHKFSSGSYQTRGKNLSKQTYRVHPYVSEFQRKYEESTSPVKKLNPERFHQQEDKLYNRPLNHHLSTKNITERPSQYDLKYLPPRNPAQRDELKNMKKRLLQHSNVNKNERSIFHQLQCYGQEEDDLSGSRIDRINRKLDNYIQANIKMR